MDGYVTIGTKLDTKDFEKQIKEVEYELDQLEYELSKKKELKLDDRTIGEYEAKAEKLKNKLIILKTKQTDLEKTNLTNVQQSIEGISKSTSGIIKKVLKWGLAVFSIRSAYALVRQSVSVLSEYNEQLATDIKYIQFALASSLEPLIQRLVQLVFSFLSYVNGIAQAWFGVDLFANASAKAMQKGVKSAKEMKKQLAGFDEMNVISDSSSSGVASGGSTAPSLDLSLSNEQAERTKNFWKDIFKFWETDWENYFGVLDGNWSTFYDGVLVLTKGFYDAFKGILEILVGLWNMLVGVFTGDMEKIKLGWDKTLKGIKTLFSGLIEGILGLLLMAGGIIKGIFLDVLGAIKNIIFSIGNFFKGLWEGIVKGVTFAVDKIKNIFFSIVGFFKGIISKILGFFKTIGVSVGNVIGSAFKGVINGVLWSIEHILNAPIRAINGLLNIVNKALPKKMEIGRLSTFNLPRLKVGGIVNMPNAGIPIGSAIAGESGKEGVIPLTDSQAMMELGQAIGKYITINANITNSMNGRVISRELQRIKADSDFAFNR